MSIVVASLAYEFSTVVGVVVGLVAGFATGWVDKVLTFFIDTFLAFPFVLGALALSPIITNRWRADADTLTVASFITVVFVLTAFGWTVLARLVRGDRKSVG